MREIGGRIVRLVPSSVEARFGLGACGSISETLSTAGFTGGGSGVTDTTGAGASLFAVIGAKADFVTAGPGAVILPEPACGFTGGLASALVTVAASLVGAAAGSSALVALEVLAVLVVARLRVDDLAAVDFAALRAGALAAVDLVVVFVGI
jgi:hypothetical protein